MKKIFMLLSLFAFVSIHAMADSKQTVTVNGSVTGKSATRITFAGDNITLSYSDGTSQTTDMSEASLVFEHVATFKAADYDNLETIKTFGGKTLGAEVTRTFTAGKWTAITLPFALSAADIESTFGSGTRVAVLQSATSESINFVSVEEMVAGMPYVICPAQTVSSFFIEQATIYTMTGSTIEGETATVKGDLATLNATLTQTGEGQGVLKGDVNHDGGVSVVDVMALVDYILNGSDNIDVAAADFNNDGTVNVADVMSIVDFVLKGSSPIAPIVFTIDGEECVINFQS